MVSETALVVACRLLLKLSSVGVGQFINDRTLFHYLAAFREIALIICPFPATNPTKSCVAVARCASAEIGIFEFC
jgi:hypothetical protein